MSGIIKFRAWDNKYGQYCDVYILKPFDNTVETSYGVRTIGNDVVLEQYIGLKDKNGTKCYHNDLFRENKTGFIYLVDASLGYKTIFVNGDVGYYPDRFINCVPSVLDGEIISNIHENTELLNER